MYNYLTLNVSSTTIIYSYYRDHLFCNYKYLTKFNVFRFRLRTLPIFRMSDQYVWLWRQGNQGEHSEQALLIIKKRGHLNISLKHHYYETFKLRYFLIVRITCFPFRKMWIIIVTINNMKSMTFLYNKCDYFLLLIVIRWHYGSRSKLCLCSQQVPWAVPGVHLIHLFSSQQHPASNYGCW